MPSRGVSVAASRSAKTGVSEIAMAERLNREYWTAERAVEEVDRFAIAERARVTLPTIRRALSQAGMIGDAA